MKSFGLYAKYVLNRDFYCQVFKPEDTGCHIKATSTQFDESISFSHTLSLHLHIVISKLKIDIWK
ncbi:hypothetical protein HMPREF3202_01699 [Prevotella bivia]|uniref:Uncharacterized protein n=1 Tax=Prevotella bivia TaxID=28125 RepID=A0A137SSL7_9BACT|nr:hypothetical protein HMPREF3202_01699 [Prevotella bivia]